VVWRECYNINFRIINNPKLLLSKFDKIEDKNLLKDNVIFLSIYNSIRASWEIAQSWEFDDSISLHNAGKEISDLNIDNIFNKDRNKIQSLLKVGTIIREGFRTLNNVTEIYYGSSTTESTFTQPSDVIKNVKRNFDNSELEKIIQGKWEPEPDMSMNSWEAFGKLFGLQ
jgi:hypothetical protein